MFARLDLDLLHVHAENQTQVWSKMRRCADFVKGLFSTDAPAFTASACSVQGGLVEGWGQMGVWAPAASACTTITGDRPRRERLLRSGATRGPSWGHLLVVLGAILSFLEPFCGRLSPKVVKISKIDF